jgi:hypothetical protein
MIISIISINMKFSVKQRKISPAELPISADLRNAEV